MKTIDRFLGQYHFLSNFYPVAIHMDGLVFPSIEHAFQAAKTFNPLEREKIRKAKTPGEAKRLGRRVTLRPDWEDVKNEIMESLVRYKFTYKVLAAELLATDDAELIEGNSWGDKNWGMVRGKAGEWIGENRLGKILMKIRDGLRKGKLT